MYDLFIQSPLYLIDIEACVRAFICQSLRYRMRSSREGRKEDRSRRGGLSIAGAPVEVRSRTVRCRTKILKNRVAARKGVLEAEMK